jgi:hypothetical protein
VSWDRVFFDRLNEFPFQRSRWDVSDGLLVRSVVVDEPMLRFVSVVEPSKFASACAAYFESLGDVIPVDLPLRPVRSYLDCSGGSWRIVGEYER